MLPAFFLNEFLTPDEEKRELIKHIEHRFYQSAADKPRLRHGLRDIRAYVKEIKPEHSPLNLLGKLFFRNQAPWEQRRKMSVVLWSVAIGLLLGGVCTLVILFQNKRH